MNSSTLTQDNFDFVRELVMREAAIVLEAGKEYLAVSRLDNVARRQGFDSVEALIRELRIAPNANLRNQVVDAMTTNETLWFRDAHPFESLQTTILPELLKIRSSTRHLDIWCAAASTGQEPYSLAIMLQEIPDFKNWSIRILATDISPSAIDRAKEGVYSQMEMGRGLPAKYMVKYFLRSGTNFQIKPEIRSMVNFRLLNLAGNWDLSGKFDLVLIRNVLIYFSQETKGDIIRRAESFVRPDGYLLLGATESLLNIQSNFERIQHGKTMSFQLKNNPERKNVQ